MHEPRVFVETTTIHGIKDSVFIEAKRTRLVWAIFLACCTSIMLYEMRVVAMEYIQKPTATQMVQRSSPTYKFPRILFCPKQWIDAEKVAKLGMPKKLLFYALSLLPDLNLNPIEKAQFISENKNLSNFDSELRRFLDNAGFSNYRDFFIAIAKTENSTGSCDNCKPIRNHLISSGVCLRVNLLSTTVAQLIQNTPSFRFLDTPFDNKSQRLVPRYSSAYTTDLLYISYRFDRKFFYYDPILLNRNFSYVLRITPVLHERFDKSTRPCVEKDAAMRERYSQSDCYFQCSTIYKKQCRDCRFLDNQNGFFINKTVEGNSTKPFCSTLLNYTKLNSENCTINDEELKECVMNCQPLCYEWVRKFCLFYNSVHKNYSTVPLICSI